MSEGFGPVSAGAYNYLYADKDYAAECGVIEKLFQRYSKSAVSSVIDLGCGTGNHAFCLAGRGYDVLGIDRSESMLALAEERLLQNPSGGKLGFQRGDIRELDLGRQFDAALIMFAVLGFQYENSDVLSALRATRRHLKKDGLLTFDVWYGPAVLHQRPSPRVKMVPTEEGRILRMSSGELDVARHVCTVQSHLWRLVGDRLAEETEETHVMRYFFPLELTLFLDCCGFSLVRLGAFPEFDRQPDESTWNVLAVARAV